MSPKLSRTVSHLPLILSLSNCPVLRHGKGAPTSCKSPAKNFCAIALRDRRQNLPRTWSAQDSARIRERLLAWTADSAGPQVMLYLPARGEVDTWPLLDHFWARGQRSPAAPLCPDPGIMDAIAVTSRGRPRTGLLRPDRTPGRPGPAGPGPEPEVILVPALAFDRRGYRLGFGRRLL
jgi:5-formyltetrahydrofolate cyclo-ligase